MFVVCPCGPRLGPAELVGVACVLVVCLRVCFVVGAGVVASAWLIVCGVRCACDVLHVRWLCSFRVACMCREPVYAYAYAYAIALLCAVC